jgi:mono/diheme cytochrome c family protein
MGAGWIGALLFAIAGSAQAAPTSPLLVARGRRLVERAQCGRCHALPGAVAATPRQRSCAGCHAWIHATREDPTAAALHRREFPLWDRYMLTVASFLEVPDLTASAARLDQAFVARYLRAPFKVRPTLPEEMIRTGFDDDDAAAVAAWLAWAAMRPWSPAAQAAAAIPRSSSAADVASGKLLFERLACGACHAAGGRAATVAGPAAPDLGFARERMSPATTAAFIADPSGMGGETRMPRYPISATQVARLRDFLLALPDLAPPVAPALAELPLLTRPVAYAEVRAQVLDRICIHCHMDGKRNGGEGGPGNTGGLGYRGAGLDLESWAGLRRGALDPRGRRVSILSAFRGEEAPLVARLRLRYAEHARELAGPAAVTAGGRPGMPLGLPPLTPEQFRLVRSWVAQGAPGPVAHVSQGRASPLKRAR